MARETTIRFLTPGALRARYPGAERGGQSGPDSDEDGDPGNPWDHSTKMSRPDDDGNGVDPLTNPAGGSPRGGGRGPVNPDDDRQESGLWDDFYKPNPEDDWGVNGPNAKSFRGMKKRQIQLQLKQ